MQFNPKRLLIIGSILLIIGVLGPLLMVIQIIENSFLISFLSYGASICGLLLGTMGAAMYGGTRKKKQ